MNARFVLLAALLLNAVSQGFCQGGGVGFFSMGFQVPSSCDPKSDPMPDGTPVYIFADANDNGPDASDPLAAICDNKQAGFRCFNYNQTEINGVKLVDWGLKPGQFYYTEHAAALENPQIRRYYVRVIGERVLANQDTVVTTWTCSKVAELNTEYQDIDCGDPDLWTCEQKTRAFRQR